MFPTVVGPCEPLLGDRKEHRRGLDYLQESFWAVNIRNREVLLGMLS